MRPAYFKNEHNNSSPYFGLLFGNVGLYLTAWHVLKNLYVGTSWARTSFIYLDLISLLIESFIHSDALHPFIPTSRPVLS